MAILRALPILFLLADTPEKAWEEASRDDGVTVFVRDRAAGNVREVKAVGMVNASPELVWRAIRDYPNYTRTMPYLEEARVVTTEDVAGSKVVHLYSVVNAPLVSRRDYTIRIRDDSQWKDGKGYLMASWSPSDKGPPPKDGVIRVSQNEGYWKLEPREEGKKTFATYYLFTDPGGSIPGWIANKANTTAVPNVFKAVRKASGTR